MRKQTIIYLLTLLLLGGAIAFMLHQGNSISPFSQAAPSATTSLWAGFIHTMKEPIAILILQIISILITARILSWVMIKIGQPTVIGEIIAGIVLGASVLGNYFPEISQFLFPSTSFSSLQLFSKMGLILFMFIIGMELDLEVVRKKAGQALIISHISIVFAYLIGASLAFYLYQEFAPKDKSFLVFALFMGTSMSIAAFPVLARIVQERGLTKSQFGSLIITCAAIDDITAWCLLAIVIALAKAGGIESSITTIILAGIYLAFMWYVVRPLFQRLANTYFARETMNRKIVAIVFIVLFISAYLTEIIGIHALIGAFMAGVIVPQNKDFRHILTEKIEDLSLILLLPLFFVYTGLRTQIGLINEPHLWAICGLIILAAILGKFLGSFLPAKLLGLPWKESLMVGALMNTRGLMELVVLNIGYELGILPDKLFAMMVLMALSTTFMTGPVLNLIDWIFDRERFKRPKQHNDFRVLVSFGVPNAGAKLLTLAHQLFQPAHKLTSISALHCTPSSDISIQDAEIFEREGFEPIKEKAQELNIRLKTHYKATNQVRHEIVNFANQNMMDLMLVGSSHSVFSNDKTGGKVQNFFEDITASVGVLIDKNFNQVKTLLICFTSEEDLAWLSYAQSFIQNTENQLYIYDENKLLAQHILMSANNVKSVTSAQFHPDFTQHLDLVLMSLTYWQTLQPDNEWETFDTSILVMKK